MKLPESVLICLIINIILLGLGDILFIIYMPNLTGIIIAGVMTMCIFIHIIGIVIADRCRL